MNEIEKMYENAEVKKQIPDVCSSNELYCKECKAHIENAIPYCKNAEYPPFTAEKQIEIEKVILQNKKTYNKWIQYNINIYGEWVIRFVRTDKFAPYVAVEKTRAEALANIINYDWQFLSDDEKEQIKEILR